jgi:hypothetical protein
MLYFDFAGFNKAFQWPAGVVVKDDKAFWNMP